MKLPKISRRENYLKSALFNYPEYIPTIIAPFYPVWNTYREKLEKIALKYPLLFPYYDPENIVYVNSQDIPYTNIVKVDAFNCVWKSRIIGCFRFSDKFKCFCSHVNT